MVRVNLAALQDDSNASLPPLMNPAILEASDDLTSLSHLNEPAGMKEGEFVSPYAFGIILTLVKCCRLSNYDIRKKKYIHIAALCLSLPTLSPG